MQKQVCKNQEDGTEYQIQKIVRCKENGFERNRAIQQTEKHYVRSIIECEYKPSEMKPKCVKETKYKCKQSIRFQVENELGCK